ncbi:MAG: RNA-processing protein [Candidatus Lokiarchaeota archaeon]|nr:RNA-processing protein [Candidatus Lokiarchaeota archaeon]
MSLLTENIKIVKDRIAVLIGKKGSTKNFIEERTQTEIDVDSKEGLVVISPKEGSKDPLGVWKARDICKAISRGFSPERSYRLLHDDEGLEIINLTDIVGKNPKRIKRIKSRLIGETGKTRRIIEENTGVYVTIYGDTISMIGSINDESMRIARKAISMIVDGIQHSTVYSFLQRMKRRLNKQKLSLWSTFTLNED